MRNAKLQALALLLCILAGLIYGVIAYMNQPRGKPPEPIDSGTPLANPSATVPAPAAEKATPSPPPPAIDTSSAASQGTAPPAMRSVIEPDKSGRIGGPGMDTLHQTPDAMKKLLSGDKKGSVPVANVLASIGVTDSEKSKRELPKVSDAKRVLELLGKATSIGDKLEFVISKPGIEERMKAFYETAKLREPEVGEQTADFQIETGGEKYLDVLYESSTRPSGTLHASFIRDEKGIVRVDWESLVGYSPMLMQDFRSKRPDQPVTMRVLASADNYYNYEFSDSKKFLSVRLRNGDGTEAMNGFCEAGGRVANAINAHLASAASKAASQKDGAGAAARRVWSPVIVKVRFPAKAQSDHCVELLDLMHDRWLAPAGIIE